MTTKAPKGEFSVQDRRPGFAIIDNELIDDYGPLLGAYGIAAYCILVRFANRQGTDAYPSYQTVGKLMGASRSTAIRSINNLVKHGLIDKEKRESKGEPQSNMYTILPVRKPQASQVVGGVPQQPPSVPRQPPSVSQQLPSVSQEPDQYTNNNTPITKEGESPVGSTATLPPSPAIAHPPSPLIERAIELADKETFDPPSSKPSSPPSSKPKPKPKPATTPRCDGRKFQGGYIPAGAGTTPVEVYYESFSMSEAKLSAPNEDDLTSACPDLDRLRSVLTAYRRSNYRKGNVQLILDWYRDGVPAFGGAPAKKGQVDATSRQSATQAGDYDWYSQFGNTPTAKT